MYTEEYCKGASSAKVSKVYIWKFKFKEDQKRNERLSLKEQVDLFEECLNSDRIDFTEVSTNAD